MKPILATLCFLLVVVSVGMAAKEFNHSSQTAVSEVKTSSTPPRVVERVIEKPVVKVVEQFADNQFGEQQEEQAISESAPDDQEQEYLPVPDYVPAPVYNPAPVYSPPTDYAPQQPTQRTERSPYSQRQETRGRQIHRRSQMYRQANAPKHEVAKIPDRARPGVNSNRMHQRAPVYNRAPINRPNYMPRNGAGRRQNVPVYRGFSGFRSGGYRGGRHR